MPAQGGSRIRNARLRAEGTLACVVQSRSNPAQQYILSAAHVLCPGGFGQRGDLIEAQIDGSWQTIATLADWTRLSPIPGQQLPFDAAIAQIIAPGLVDVGIAGIGHAPVGLAGYIYPGMSAQVFGATTGRLMSGQVHSTDRDVRLSYQDPFDGHEFVMAFGGQILYGEQGAEWAPITTPGDSGALVLDAFGNGLGLHIASTAASFGIRASVCTSLQQVLTQLDVALVTGPVPPGLIPGVPAAAAGLIFDREELNRRADARFGIKVLPLLEAHRCYVGSVSWQLTPEGLSVDGQLDRSRGALVTVPRVWHDYGPDICRWALQYRVPVELIVATICTESGGDPNVPSRPESGGRMSVGLMQTLIGTAQEALKNTAIDEAWLSIPAQSIQAGTACIAAWRGPSGYDPPLVACVYNAGGIREDQGTGNRWKLAQYPFGTGRHADRFVQWFNDCFAHFSATPGAAPSPTVAPSFWQLFR